MMISADVNKPMLFPFDLVRCNLHHLSLPLDAKNLTNLRLGFKERWTNGFDGESGLIHKVPVRISEILSAQ